MIKRRKRKKKNKTLGGSDAENQSFPFYVFRGNVCPMFTGKTLYAYFPLRTSSSLVFSSTNMMKDFQTQSSRKLLSGGVVRQIQCLVYTHEHRSVAYQHAITLMFCRCYANKNTATN